MSKLKLKEASYIFCYLTFSLRLYLSNNVKKKKKKTHTNYLYVVLFIHIWERHELNHSHIFFFASRKQFIRRIMKGALKPLPVSFFLFFTIICSLWFMGVQTQKTDILPDFFLAFKDDKRRLRGSQSPLFSSPFIPSDSDSLSRKALFCHREPNRPLCLEFRECNFQWFSATSPSQRIYLFVTAIHFSLKFGQKILNSELAKDSVCCFESRGHYHHSHNEIFFVKRSSHFFTKKPISTLKKKKSLKKCHR